MDETLSGVVGIVVGLFFRVGDVFDGVDKSLLELAVGGDVEPLAVGDTVAVADVQPCV